MAWVSGNFYLSTDQTINNAQLAAESLVGRGWSREAGSALLGNMQSESGINPGIWESLTVNYSGGFGLTQWTPATKLIEWAEPKNYEDPEVQLDRIDWESANNQQWFANPNAPVYNPPISFTQFKTANTDPETLANWFLWFYEHPAVTVQPVRAQQARWFYENLDWSGSCTPFNPRLTESGIQGNRLWYADNPFYQAGYGLPNCTCYAWGRFWELNPEYGRPTLGTGNADTWYGTSDGYQRSDEPALGAVICFSYSGAIANDGGHVAVVEQINDDKSIVTSNSAYGGTYFYTQTLTPPDYTWSPNVHKQGFILSPTHFCGGGGYIPPPTPSANLLRYIGGIKKHEIRRHYFII